MQNLLSEEFVEIHGVHYLRADIEEWERNYGGKCVLDKSRNRLLSFAVRQNLQRRGTVPDVINLSHDPLRSYWVRRVKIDVVGMLMDTNRWLFFEVPRIVPSAKIGASAA